MALVPKIVAQSILLALSNRTVDNDDVLRSQQTWFSYAFVHLMAVLRLFTGNLRERGHMGRHTGYWWQQYHGAAEPTGVCVDGLWDDVGYGALLYGQLGPMVRMSVQTYFGWSHKSMTDQGNMMGSFLLALSVYLGLH
ncbi:unnamed protein product [Peronospora belbahrii]|uniref:Uncharacterized protein n=1 Tax=Peronospora belbahrii TaxID=622444 RepID=A0ABN8CV15_9STRA|nr:unnamed protein product [Peronospora belbahrii]